LFTILSAVTVSHAQQSVRFKACRRPAACGATERSANNVRPPIHAANPHGVSEFFHILARYFHETRGSLNFLTVHSCSQNLPLISCMYA